MSKKGLNKGVPSRKLTRFVSILEPNERFPFHVEGSHVDALILGRLIVIEKLVDFVSPTSGVVAIKTWKIQPQGSGLK
jgi:hypothetical protein